MPSPDIIKKYNFIASRIGHGLTVLDFYRKFKYPHGARAAAEKDYLDALGLLINNKARTPTSLMKNAKRLRTKAKADFEQPQCLSFWRDLERHEQIKESEVGIVGARYKELMKPDNYFIYSIIAAMQKKLDTEVKLHVMEEHIVMSANVKSAFLQRSGRTDSLSLEGETENDGESIVDDEGETESIAGDDGMSHELLVTDSQATDRFSSLILDSGFTLEEIWEKVMSRLNRSGSHVQSIESRIIDLAEWNNVEWRRILETGDHGILIKRTRRMMEKTAVDAKVRNIIGNPPDGLMSIAALKTWKMAFESIDGEDARLAAEIVSYFEETLSREINILVQDLRERDVVMKILGPLLGNLLEKFDIGRFEVYWIEKECKAVTARKRRHVDAKYSILCNDTMKMDMIVEMRGYEVELLLLEIGNSDSAEPTSGNKCRLDRCKLKIALKDCVDMFWWRLGLKKKALQEVFLIGLQIIGHRWIAYSMSYDPISEFYFFNQLATFELPTTLSNLEDFLPRFILNLLSLRRTLLQQDKYLRQLISANRDHTPTPPSSPPQLTSTTPNVKKQKGDPFEIFDNIYEDK
ncbi:LOW QUALITY PROTEIN: hypothetical protein BC938DRAFT_478968 [Jimgerdemannia flammicorona]|uniref:Uncharacterized protein n=1 Tax=Jimgerdemannia flammicorona TaxID=994334 RepID=A0A433QY39_9FUNG|nr:LOW QUALITY PROTEIN: hypothetical protein BC938DRAFT_478968 [Jimgerdemannia flammicorona]